MVAGVLLWPAGMAAIAADSQPGPGNGVAAGPSLSLNAYGRAEWVQDAREPLLLVVGLANPEAARVDAMNRDALVKREAYRRSGVLDTMPEKDFQELKKELVARPIPTFSNRLEDRSARIAAPVGGGGWRGQARSVEGQAAGLEFQGSSRARRPIGITLPLRCRSGDPGRTSGG